MIFWHFIYLFYNGKGKSYLIWKKWYLYNFINTDYH